MPNGPTMSKRRIAGAATGALLAGVLVIAAVEPAANGQGQPATDQSSAINASAAGIVSTNPLDAPTEAGIANRLAYLASNPVPTESLDPRAQLDRQLSESYSGTYAGMSVAADGSYVIHEKSARDNALETAAVTGFGALPNKFAQSESITVPSTAAKVSFQTVQYSLAELSAARDLIASKLGSLHGIFAVALDLSTNKLWIGTQDNQSASEQLTALGSAVQADMLELHFSPDAPHTSAATGRYGDVAPWNGGDQLVALNSGTKHGCTNSFAMRNTSTGVVNEMTDGHCSNQYWYNTNYNSPTYNANTLMGISIGSSNPYTNHNSGVDSQLLDLGSKTGSCISWGGYSTNSGNLQRISQTGYANPVNGATVRQEGSFSTEQTATVTGVNATFSETDDNTGKTFTINGTGFITNAPPIGGDSGGPVIENSIYGPLATGMITSTDTYYDGYHQMIDSMRYIYQANPVTC